MISHEVLIKKFVDDGATEGRGSRMFIDGDVLYSFGHHFPLLVRTPSGFVLNADKYSSTTSKHQGLCMKHATIQIPFSVLVAAGIIGRYGRDFSGVSLTIASIAVLDSHKARWDWTGRWDDGKQIISNAMYEAAPQAYKDSCRKVEERRPEAALIEVNSRLYLSSMDGRNYFMCLLPDLVTTVEEAFESLKPSEVIGKTFKRQGEWFFVETSPLNGQTAKKMYSLMPQSFVLPKKNPASASHIATRGFQIDKDIYVSGHIRHERGDHTMLNLSNSDNPKIFLAYENRALASYSASGNVD